MRVVPWEEIFKFGALAAITKFYGWVYIGIDVHILNRKYNDKSHLSPWFSVACASAIAHRNHSFPLIQQSNSSASEVKFKQAISRCCHISLLKRNKRVDHFPETWLT